MLRLSAPKVLPVRDAARACGAVAHILHKGGTLPLQCVSFPSVRRVQEDEAASLDEVYRFQETYVDLRNSRPAPVRGVCPDIATGRGATAARTRRRQALVPEVPLATVR